MQTNYARERYGSEVSMKNIDDEIFCNRMCWITALVQFGSYEAAAFMHRLPIQWHESGLQVPHIQLHLLSWIKVSNYHVGILGFYVKTF